MKWFRKLSNPFALVAQGFVVGAILIAASTPSLLETRAAAPSAPLDSSIIPNSAR